MALAAVGIKTAIWNNNIRSIFLLGLYPVILAVIVWGISALYGMQVHQHAYASNDPQIWGKAVQTANDIVAAWWPTILAAVSIWFLIALLFHTQMTRMLSSSRPVTRSEEPMLYDLLENLCISRGLPMPRLEVIETDALNAFASGISQKSYTITVTRGLLRALNKDEVEAVLGHELTHILNNDVRLLIISIIFVGMLGLASQLLWNSLRMGAYSRSRQKGGGAMVFLLAVGVILWIGYFATMFTRLALSRRREYMADAGAVELTKNPSAMMSALLRIENRDRIPQATGDVALMCIENSQPFFGLFATHPSVADRVRALSEITHTPVPDMQDTSSAGPWGRT